MEERTGDEAEKPSSFLEDIVMLFITLGGLIMIGSLFGLTS